MYIVQYLDTHSPQWRNKFMDSNRRTAELEFDTAFLEYIKSGYTGFELRLVLTGPAPDYVVREVINYKRRD